MEIAPGRHAVLFIFSVTVLFLAGCSPAYKGNLFKLDLPDDCPGNEEALTRDRTDPLTAGQDQLRCALQAVRNMQPPERQPRAHEALTASRICSLLAESSPAGAAGDERRKSLAWEGVAWAKYSMGTGLAIDPATSYYYSINLGIAVRDSILTAMKYLGRLQRHLGRAVREAPELDSGGPLRTMGYLLIKAPPWPAGIGDPEKGIEMLRKAVEQFPDYPPNRIYLARGLWEADEDEDSALEIAKAAADSLRAGSWGIRHQAWIRDLSDLLNQIGNQDAADEILSGLDSGSTAPTGTDAANQAGGNSGLSPSVP